MADVGLLNFRCDVRYGPIHFSTSKVEYWLPMVAEIAVESPRQAWRNVHRFTDYKRFSTDVKMEIKP